MTLNDWLKQGSHSVRASVRRGERLLFTTDTFTPVLRGAPASRSAVGQDHAIPPLVLGLVKGLVGGAHQYPGARTRHRSMRCDAEAQRDMGRDL